jgi:heterodisulfide reductase subunit B
MDVGFELKEKAGKLQEALLARHPTMPSLLADIHRALKAQPENITLLSEEEIGVIVSGLEVQTQTHLADTMVKGKNSTGAKATVNKIKSLGADAF